MAKAEWNISKDAYFVELMVNECHIIHKPANGLTKEAWIRIVQQFTSKYGAFYQKDKLLNRKKTLLEHYKMLKYLQECSSGFGWEANRLTAPESVWEEIIKNKPSARNYMDKSFPSYASLCTLFQEGYADGRGALAGDEVANIIESSIPEIPRSSSRAEGGGRESADSSGEETQHPPSKRSRSEGSSRGNKPKAKDADREVISRIASAVEKFSDTYAEAAEASKHSSIPEVLAALEATPTLTAREYSQAATLLASDPMLRDLFILLPASRRLDWLQSTLR